MVISTGRNSLFENVYRAINRFFRSNVSGSQRSVVLPNGGGNSFTSIRRNYDLEIVEVPVRNYEFAEQVIELVTYCSEAKTAIEVIRDGVFSNQDGDDIGFKIDDVIDDGSAIDPKVKKILDDLLDRVMDEIIYGSCVDRMLKYGDAFLSVGIGKTDDGLGVVKLLTLPTWEIFRVEDDQANLLRFEQRKSLADTQPAYKFHPAQIVHLRHRRDRLYGTPMFGLECFSAWENLKNSRDALYRTTLEIGYNPTVHEMPPGTNKGYKDAYKADLENQLQNGVVTQYYVESGAKVSKLSVFNPDLTAMSNAVLLAKSELITRSRLPVWMFSGFTAINGNTAKEISEQPALETSRLINSCRMRISEGLKQLCHTELLLKGVPEEKRKFRIVFPKFYISTTQLADPENQEESDPTNPNGKANAQPKKPAKAKQSSKASGDSLEFLESMSKDELIDILTNSSDK